MTDVRYLLVDEVSGDAIAELPLEVEGAISFGYNTVGGFEASMPCDLDVVTKANFTEGLRSITVIRDDSAEFSGLVTEITVDSDTRRLNLAVSEASEYFGLRTIEEGIHYNRDRFSWVRNLFTVITTKTSTTGDGTASPGLTINADIPRFSVSTGTSGFTLDDDIPADSRFTFAEVLQILTEDPTEGIEWRMDYRTGSNRQSCHRTLTLGAPLGVTRSQVLTAPVLYSYGKTYDLARSATRVHVRGSGYTATKQNTGSITDGWPLIEQVYDRGDTAKQARLGNIAREYRRKAQPPVKMPRIVFEPSTSLPFGWCDIGDTLTLDVDDPCELLSMTSQSRRVVGVEWTPPSGENPERVALLLNLPLSELGS